MQITVGITSKVEKIFKKGLQNLDSSEIRKAVITRYIQDMLSDDNLELAVEQYLDSIEESGDLGDIIYEVENN
jgi:hypothetical protein